MKNLDLVAQLSWAIVELGTARTPNNSQVIEVLEMALEKALLEAEKAAMVKRSLIRTAAVTGESITGGK
jgi:hypothetical protein